MKENRKDDIYGLRDFYHLNKGISTNLSNLKEIDEIEEFKIVRKNLKKNFSGLGNEHEILWKQYCKLMGKPEKVKEIEEPSVIDLIKSNLKDHNSRYLMIITENDSISEYIEFVLKKEYEVLDSKDGKNVKVIVGSKMIEDSKETYGYRILSDIILYIEKGYTLIFRKVNNLYGSLYDLFNQNFSINGDKKYCKIALGALSNAKCLVNQDFHCLIFLNEKELEQADPPFLNRFEKYHIKLNYILNEKQIHILNDLCEWIQDLLGSKDSTNLNHKFLFPNFSPEYLIFLIKSINKDGVSFATEKLLKLCKLELIKVASFDFNVLVSQNNYDDDEKNEILKDYYDVKSEGFTSFVKRNLENEKRTSKILIYTYTQITEVITYKEIKFEIKEIKLGNFKSEQELKEEIKRFLLSTQNLLVIRVNQTTEGHHLLFLKQMISNYLDDITNYQNKHFMIIIHLKRFCLEEIEFETLFQEWNLMMFDHLNKEYLLPLKCLEDKSFKLLSHSEIMIAFPEIFYNIFDYCISKFTYLTNGQSSEKINERRNFILERIKKNEGNLIQLIKGSLDEKSEQKS